MTRVLLVSHTAEKGGAELFLVDAVRRGPAGWRGAFLSAGPAAAALAQDGRPPLVLAGGDAMLAIRRGSGMVALAKGASDVFKVARDLAHHANAFDLLCANSQKSLFVCAIAALLAKRPLVWILHDIITDPAFSAVNRRAAIAVANLLAAAVIVNSQETGEAFVAAGGRAELVRQVNNGFVVEEWPQASAAAAKQLRSTFNLGPSPVVSIFGRITEWKGQHVLLDALARVPDAQGLIVGGALFGHGEWEQRLRARAAALGIADRVRFAGFRDDVPALMAGSDVIVHASTAPEPFGRVIVEAMLTGRPVIATQGGAIGSIIDHGRTGLMVPPSNPHALAAAIQLLLSSPQQAAEMANEGRTDVAARFDLRETHRVLQAIFTQAVAGKLGT